MLLHHKPMITRCRNGTGSLQFVLQEYFPPSPNILNAKHWRHKTHEKNRCMEHVSFSLLGIDIPRFEGAVKMSIARAYRKPKQPMDPDNLVAACKMLIDCIREPSPNMKRRSRGLGIIKDDTREIIPGGPKVIQFQMPDRSDYLQGVNLATLVKIDGVMIDE